ncbi:26S proteasome non-ATPase regulatory subunit 5-like [Varroa jacobsoni]|uniref:26S proteasome non-ATPase regulatory subunit 5 n=1 Tax=Varroa destructor TaxID=109461 RepID=A0A7M7M8B8_VARDE|nr:26S proteasome non-ATPase regulatory subunit 5-like [Varroa destructor]XP_022686638.1 26S proteasome non-ATPase regulatory subunit 5-like [Varroa jacobsoni]
MRKLGELLRDLADPEKINVENLNVIKSACSDHLHHNRLEFSSSLQNSDLSQLFVVLANLKNEEIQLFCQILRTLLDCVPCQLILTKYERYITEALREQCNDDIQKLVLQQLLRCARDEKVRPNLVANTTLLAYVIDRFASMTLNDSVKSLLLELTTHSIDALKILFSGDLLQRLEAVQQKGSVENLRVLELFCQVACQSEANCKKMAQLLDKVVESLKREKSDMLVLLNYIELLRILVSKPYTMDYIRSSTAVEILKDLLSHPDDPNATFYMPGVLLFFGEFGLHNPIALVHEHTAVVKVIFETARLGSPFAPTAMAAVGQIARTRDGKRCIEENLSREMAAYMRDIGKCLEMTNYSAEHKMSALIAVQSILEMEEYDQLDVITLSEKWMSCLSTTPLALLWKCAKTPFPNERLAALRVMKNIALLPWGRQGLLELPGSYEWLLDRNTEPDKAGKEIKHAIVAALLEEANSIKDVAQVKGLRKFYAEGPFYSPADVAIATEGGS